MDRGTIIGGTAVLISLVILISQVIGQRNVARASTVDLLINTVTILRGELSAVKERANACEQDRVKLTSENQVLMRKLLKMDPNS